MAFCLGSALVKQSAVLTGYTDPAYLTQLKFGVSSHWVQPWRSTFETVRASDFLNSVGINFDVPDGVDPMLVAQMLAKHGVRHARIEVGWSCIDFDTGRLREDAKASLQRKLNACRIYGIRPLILLNGNAGAPCPVRFFSCRLTAPASKGDRTVQVDDSSQFKIGRSGLNNLSDYWAAEALVMAITGHTLTLSKPLPRGLGTAGKEVSCSTLKYAPFGDPASPEYSEAIEGWRHYTEEVSEFVRSRTAKGFGLPGFDLEVWNELSFGSQFLYRRLYFDQPTVPFREDDIWTDLVRATGRVVATKFQFHEISLCDGFSNTVPWPASSVEHEQVDAISKHPYKGMESYPETKRDNQLLLSLQVEEKPSWSPTYTACFPEFFGTGLQTETILRDSSPITTDIYGVEHGRLARRNDTVSCWFTEVGMAPKELGIQGSLAANLKAKTTARYLSFYVNKGVRRIYFYSACSGDDSLGMVKDSFLGYAKTHSEIQYPKDDSAYTSPALKVIMRMTSLMAEGLAEGLPSTRALGVTSVTEPKPQKVFEGDGTAKHPPLYNRDVLAILPYQVNAHRFVVPYYVMTRDVRKTMSDEKFDVVMNGFRQIKSVKAVDILSGAQVGAKFEQGANGLLKLHLLASDAPRFLIVQE